MIGPAARALIRRLARGWTAGTLARALAVWGVAALAVSNLAAAAAGVLGLLSKPLYDAILMAVLSAFPIALFYPPDPRSGLLVLRTADERAILESALAAAPGSAAEPLLRERGEALASRTRRRAPRRFHLSRSGRIFLASAAAVVAVSQAASLLATGRPLLGYASAPAGAGRAEEGAKGFSRPEDRIRDPEDPFDRSDYAEGAEEKPAASGPERTSGAAEFADLHGLLRSDRAGAAGEPGGEEPLPEGREPSDAPRAEGAGAGLPGGGADRGGRPAPAGSAPEESEGSGGGAAGPEGRNRAQGPGSGWADAPGDLGRNAMKDYRAAFEKVFAERTRAAVTAGTELSLSELESAVSRYFESLRLRVGVDPEEDPRVSGLRSAWLRARGGLK